MGYEFFVVLVPVLAWWGNPACRKLSINLFVSLFIHKYFNSQLCIFDSLSYITSFYAIFGINSESNILAATTPFG